VTFRVTDPTLLTARLPADPIYVLILKGQSVIWHIHFWICYIAIILEEYSLLSGGMTALLFVQTSLTTVALPWWISSVGLHCFIWDVVVHSLNEACVVWLDGQRY
jgi:hypothetical protein